MAQQNGEIVTAKIKKKNKQLSVQFFTIKWELSTVHRMYFMLKAVRLALECNETLHLRPPVIPAIW